MGRRVREAAFGNGVDADGRRLKHAKLLRDGHDYAGENWSWRTFLERLHFFLEKETERDALAWLEDGSQFLVEHAVEVKLAHKLRLRVCSLRQVLEALNFEYLEESYWGYTIYHHGCFVRGDPARIEQIAGYNMPLPDLSPEKDMAMPSVAYSSELKPLEIRLSLPDSHSQSWEVTIAPSVLPRPAFDTTGEFNPQESTGNVNAEATALVDMLDNSDQWSEHDMNSPLWWSQRSDFSSICTDDLSDMDTLSQISAFY